MGDLKDVLKDMCTPEALCGRIGEVTGHTPNKRTLTRWEGEPDGLVSAEIAGRKLYHVPSAITFLERRLRFPNPTRESALVRRRGRHAPAAEGTR